ncbi:MAG: hypothetical protein JAY74_17950 [Candidatus Thiodiazotropha taylori]|nr:hypothetical protein [Candidatus Thiodiazotropha taylori]
MKDKGMIESLLEIFSDTKDQARAITAIFVSVMALSAVFINQWFTSRRARKEKLVEKIEELHLLLLDALNMVRDKNSSIEELYSTIQRINMLASLYFRDLVESSDNVIALSSEMLNARNNKSYDEEFELGDALRSHLSAALVQTEILMSKHMH